MQAAVNSGIGWPDTMTLHGLDTRDSGERTVLVESAKPTVHFYPEFVLDLSGRNLPPCGMWGAPWDIHGTCLFQGEDCLLTASNLVVERSGVWHCESMQHRGHILAFYSHEGFDAIHAGNKPRLTVHHDDAVLSLGHLTAADLPCIDAPVFLATPAEPDNWGRWVIQVIPRLLYFKQNCRGMKLLCRMATPWQRALAGHLGLPESSMIAHDPGHAYRCRRISMLQQSPSDGAVSDRERAMLLDIAAECSRGADRGFGDRIYVSRLGDAIRRPNYRVLWNEPELIGRLSRLGFIAIEPETMSFPDQVRAFHGASVVAGLGGAGMFNVAFCRPGTKLVTIEASDTFINTHTGLFSSLGLAHGVIYGRQHACRNDSGNPHRPWTIDAEQTVAAIRDFIM